MTEKKAKVEKPEMEFISVYIMGHEYKIPKGLTILKAMEYAGYKIIRGVGCRAGFCGACATIYRLKEDYKFYTALACQTTAEDGMYLAQIPFVPANRTSYELDGLTIDENPVLALYPEVARCVSCNTCTKACPQELEVMDYIQAALRGDYAEAARLSFDCIQCGLCAARCPAEIHHFHVAQLARRLNAKFLSPPSPELKKRIEELDKGKYKKDIAGMKKMRLKALKQKYTRQQKSKKKGE